MVGQTFLRVLGLVLPVCLCALSVRAENIPGFSQAGRDQIRIILSQAVEKRELPGAVFILARDGKIVLHEAFGDRKGPAPGKLTKASVFRLYSMVKPIVTTAAMILVEREKLRLDDPLSKYLPAFSKMRVLDDDGKEEPAKRPILIEDLIQHTSGLTYGFFGDGPVRSAYQSVCFGCTKDLAELADVIARLPLEHHPGEYWEYSRSIDVLARVVEVASGLKLDDFLEREIFQPLGMQGIGFGTRNGRAKLLAGGGVVQENPTLPGGEQLLSSALDYYRFSQALLNGGELDGKRILKEKTVNLMMQDHLARRNIQPGKYIWNGKGWGFGYGFAVSTTKIDKTSNFPAPLGTVFWSGYGGTSFWIDPANKIIGVFMMASTSKRRHYAGLMRRLVYLGKTEPSGSE